MPDELKPDASSDEELQPDSGQPVGNGVADGPAEDAAAEEPAENAAGAEQPESDVKQPVVNEGDVSEEDAEAAMLAMLRDQGIEDSPDIAEGDHREVGDRDEFPDLSGVQMEQPMASAAEFQQLSPSNLAGDRNKNIEMLLDVKMPVSIELGRTDIAISDLLSLGPGSVVELNKLAGEPVDLLVNDKIIAKGEVVVVDENFGVRITLLMSPEERLKSMAQG